jgi:hypothetical protein
MGRARIGATLVNCFGAYALFVEHHDAVEQHGEEAGERIYREGIRMFAQVTKVGMGHVRLVG